MTDITFTCDPELDNCTDGFRLVDAAYIEKHYPRRPPPHPNLTAEMGECVQCAALGTCITHRQQADENVAHVLWQESQRTGAANTVYPCPIHNADVFIRWRSGDWPVPKSAKRREQERLDAERRLERAAAGTSTRSISELLAEPPPALDLGGEF
jgi:hypothetical protein